MSVIAVALPYFSDILTIQPMSINEVIISFILLVVAFGFWKICHRYKSDFKAFFIRLYL